jgi:hypothetical protein
LLAQEGTAEAELEGLAYCGTLVDQAKLHRPLKYQMGSVL